MAVIDLHGLLDGKRLRKCSLMARLWWPYFYLLANGYGRIELDYDALVSRFFSFGKDAPTAENIKAYFVEYANVHLAFIYQPNGQQWAQWDSRASNQKRWKSSPDQASPAPPEAQYRAWLKAQHGDNWPQYHWNPKAASVHIPEIPPETSTSLTEDLQKTSVNVPKEPEATAQDKRVPSLVDKHGITASEKLEDVKTVFAYWIERTGRNPNINDLDDKKRKMGLARYETCLKKADPGQGPSDLRANVRLLMNTAVDELAASDFHMGREPGKAKTFNTWDILFRSDDKFMEWLNRADQRRRSA